MEQVAIGIQTTVADERRAFRQALNAALSPLTPHGVRLDAEDVERGDLVFLACRLERECPAAVAAQWRGALAAVLVSWIVERREPALLQRLVAGRYSYFSPEESATIVGLAASALGEADTGHGSERRRGHILERLLDYLERHSTLVLDGFVTFRLKEYMDELATAVDRAVEDFLLEREYREFIELLRHVVQSQADRPPQVHCLFEPACSFRLEDAAGQPVAADLPEDLGPEATAHEVGLEDLLVSALITVAPEALCLHVPDDAGVVLSPEALDTLQEVFTGAVSVCRGCARCVRHALL